jgi:hypothetical protein
MRYKVQFTADQAYVDLLEHVRDLLQHRIPNRDLAKIHQLALESLLEKLGRRKYAARRSDFPAAHILAKEILPGTVPHDMLPPTATRRPPNETQRGATERSTRNDTRLATDTRHPPDVPQPEAEQSEPNLNLTCGDTRRPPAVSRSAAEQSAPNLNLTCGDTHRPPAVSRSAAEQSAPNLNLTCGDTHRPPSVSQPGDGRRQPDSTLPRPDARSPAKGSDPATDACHGFNLASPATDTWPDTSASPRVKAPSAGGQANAPTSRRVPLLFTDNEPARLFARWAAARRLATRRRSQLVRGPAWGSLPRDSEARVSSPAPARSRRPRQSPQHHPALPRPQRPRRRTRLRSRAHGKKKTPPPPQ